MHGKQYWKPRKAGALSRTWWLTSASLGLKKNKAIIDFLEIILQTYLTIASTPLLFSRVLNSANKLLFHYNIEMKWRRENGNKTQPETWLQIRPGTWFSLRFASEKYSPPMKCNSNTLSLKIGLVYIYATAASVTICMKNLSPSHQKNLGWKRCSTSPMQIRANLIRLPRALYSPVTILKDSDDIIYGQAVPTFD